MGFESLSPVVYIRRARAVAVAPRILPILIGLALGLSLAVPAWAITVTRASAPTIYFDAADGLTSAYAAYAITNDTGPDLEDAWVAAGGFSGALSLAANEDGVVRLGPLATGQTRYAYFYLAASGVTGTQFHTITVYEGEPGQGGAAQQNALFGLSSTSVGSNNANTVSDVTVEPVVALGGLYQMTVTGSLTNLSGARTMAFTPSAFADWPADALTLTDVQLVVSAGANAGTYDDALFLTFPSTASTTFTITYTFRVSAFKPFTTSFFPVQYADSPPGVRHTTGVDAGAYGPVPAIQNGMILSKIATPSTVAAGDTVTYTVTVINGATRAVTLDDLDDVLPTSPGVMTYLPGAATFNGTPIADPQVNGQNLRFLGPFAIPAGGVRQLAYQVVVPGQLGTYTNRVTGRVVREQIDASAGTGDDAPATANVQVSDFPVIGLAKALVAGPTSNGDGSYDLTFRFTVENPGEVVLNGVQILENLGVVFAAADGFGNLAVRVISGGLTANPGYTGTGGGTGLLAGGNTLGVGATGVVELDVTVTPGTTLTYQNTATAAGTSPGLNNALDTSTDGLVPDANGNGNPADDFTTTPVDFVENATLGLAKRVLFGPTNNGDGTHTITYRIHVENFGDIPLESLNISDNLGVTFSAADGFTVQSVSVVQGSLTLNPGFTGVLPNQQLLQGTDTLSPGEIAAITITLTVNSGGNLGPYNNAAGAGGLTPGGTIVQDTSTNGPDPDPDGNGDPGDNSLVTPVTLVENPEIGLAKAIQTGPVNNADGTFTITYRYRIENSGDMDLGSLALTDNLGNAFSGAGGFTVDALTPVSGGLNVNPGYTGSTPNTGMLAAGNTLDAGATASVDLTVTVTPAGNAGPYLNSALAGGVSAGGPLVTDASHAGVDPDPEGNGPGDNSTPTQVTLQTNPELGLAKALVGSVVNNQDGTYAFTYRLRIENSGDLNVSDVQITDDLAATFAGSGGFTVDAVRSVSGGLTVDPTFDGSAPDTDLLAAGSALPAGANAVIEIDVTASPDGNFGPYNNTAFASGTAADTTPLVDASTNGNVPDANGNGDPGDDAVPTPVDFSENPVLGVAKALIGAPVNNGNGTYDLTYRVVVVNDGDVNLTGLQLTENLASTFAGADGFSVLDVRVVSGPLTENPGFTGSGGGTGLLTGANVLVPAAGGTLELDVRVTPGADLGPYDNAVLGAATSAGGAPVTDLSTDGADPDPDGNGDPGDNAVPTPVSFTENPELGAAKRLVSTVNNGDGTHTVVFGFVLENSGDVVLDNLGLIDNLDATFPGPAYAVASLQVTGGGLAANPGYTGTGAGMNLLAAGNSLAAGATATLELTLTVTPGGDLGPFGNQASAAGTSPAGQVLNDLSTDGTDPDADGNGDPGNDGTPTPVALMEMPAVGLAKTVSVPPVKNGDGTQTLTLRFTVENLGDGTLSALQIGDDLASVLAGVTAFQVDQVTSPGGAFSPNPAYTGTAPDTLLLTGTDTLPIGATGTLDVVLTAEPASALGPFDNTATVTAQSPAGAPVSDRSTDGLDPDPDGNGDAGDNSVPTAIRFLETPVIGVAKAVTAGPTGAGDGSYLVTYRLTVENFGNSQIESLQITDDLTAAFAGVTGFDVTAVSPVAGGLTPNAGFTGAGADTLVLAGTNVLAQGASAAVDVTVRVTPGAALGTYTNSAGASGFGPSGEPTADRSVDGIDPDPDGDDDPANNALTTPVTFTEDPVLGIAKAIFSGPTNNGNGTFTLTYRFTVANGGDVPVRNVQIGDEIAATFAGANGYTVNALASNRLTTRVGYSGAGADTVLLVGNDSLAVGEAASVNLTVTVTPGSNPGPYDNLASVAGASPAGAALYDLSVEGAVPDADGNDDPTDDTGFTRVRFDENPLVGVAKEVINGPVNNGDGTFSLAYRIRVENAGDVVLNGIQVSDDLAGVFAGTDGVQVDGVTGGGLTPNPAYSGTAPDTLLLSGGNSLIPGATGSVEIRLTVTAGALLGPFSNFAYGEAATAGGGVVRDVSTDGADPDPDSNNDPRDNSEPTVVTFDQNPALGLAKALAAPPVNNGDGTFDLTFVLGLENLGDTELRMIQVADDLAGAFAGADAFTVQDVRAVSGGLTLEPAYTGTGADTLLLAGDDSLAVGATASLEVDLRVTPGANPGPYANQAWTRAESRSGAVVQDLSTDGADPDPDADGDPGNDSVPTPVQFSETPVLGLAKRVLSGPVDNADSTFTFTYRFAAENFGDVDLTGLEFTDDLAAAFPGVRSIRVDAVTPVSGGLTVNPAFDGIGDTALLAGTDTLAAGATASIDLALTVNPGSDPGPYANQAAAAASSPGGTAVTDLSTDGADPDPDGNGDPGDDGATTPITFPIVPADAFVLLELAGDRSEVSAGEQMRYQMLAENRSATRLVGVGLQSRVPAGFRYAGGSGRVVRAGADGLFGTADDARSPLEPTGAGTLLFSGVDIDPGETVALSYATAVGTGIPPGEYETRSMPLRAGVPIGNEAVATVALTEDPIFDQTTMVGRVFHDRNGNARLDRAGATGVRLEGGFDRAIYINNTTYVDMGDGQGPKLRVDRGVRSPLEAGLTLGDLDARESQLDPVRTWVIEARLRDAPTGNVTVTTDEGSRFVLAPDGSVTTRHTGAKARGYTGQELIVTRTQRTVADGTILRITIANAGLEERGLPGVKVVSPDGLVMVTDRFGRYHLPDVRVPRPERGANVMFKVDDATLPRGATFTTENPRVIRVTPGLMTRIDFGVQFPDPQPSVTGGPVTSESVSLPGGGSVWSTVDASGLEPTLQVGAPEAVPVVRDTLQQSLTFTLSTNYAAFIDRWELVFYEETDPDLGRPIYILRGTGIGNRTTVPWDGLFGERRPRAGETFFYVLRVFDRAGHRDRTEPHRITFVEDLLGDGTREHRSGDPLVGIQGGEVMGQGAPPALQTIPVHGSRVRVFGREVAGDAVFLVDGEPVTRDPAGAFTLEMLLPPGEHAVPVEMRRAGTDDWNRPLQISVPESQFFFMGLADVTVGQNNVSGSMEPVSGTDRFDGDVFVDGRVAMYLKGKVQGKYLLTAHLDTGEEDFSDLLDNLDRKDPRSVFRRLDPDRYYPVYGDESTVFQDAESQGKLYARVDWDRSHVMWGNYQTGFTGTEFAQYNRSLFGGQLAFRTRGTNAYGEENLLVQGFASETQTAFAHNEFLGTGGSLYYLQHTDIVEGSEKVWVEVRDRDSDRVLENVALVRYRDYEIDELQGRLILTRPLATVADGVAPSIVRDEPLDGNRMVLLVDYEFVPAGFTAGNMSYGGRAKAHAGEVAALGGTLVQETRDGTDYELYGADGTLRATRGTYLKGEYAESHARQAAVGQYSDDGGLTFRNLDAGGGEDREGAAMGIEARVDFDELSGGRTRGEASGWWKQREAGFSTARLETPVERTEYGGKFLWHTARLSLAGTAAQLEDEAVRSERRYGGQLDYRFSERLTASGEVRRLENEVAAVDTTDATLGAVKLAYEIYPGGNVYGIGQGTLAHSDSYEENNLGTLGFRGRINDRLGILAEGSAGSRGTAVRVGASIAVTDRFALEVENTSGSLDQRAKASANWQMSDSHRFYGTYTMTPDRTESGRRGVLTLGQRKALSNQVEVFTENQFTNGPRESGVTHVFGLDLEPARRWTAGISIQSSNLDDAVAGRVDRDAVSLSVGFRQAMARAAGKVEFRKDRGSARRIQWLTTNRFDFQVLEGLSLLGKLSFSLTEDQDDDAGDARFVESSVGAAYRPEKSDAVQILGKYTFLYDLPAREQLTLRTDERAHVASSEALFDVTQKIGVGGKLAGRWGELREDRAQGDWSQSRAYLAVVRGRYHLISRWDAMVEYRWLTAPDADDRRQGALIGVDRHLGDHLKLGAGFNFTAFDDDLSRLDYDSAGWFLNFVGKY